MSDKKIILKTIKIGLVGDSTSGKTDIVNSFFNIEFDKDMLSTIGSDKLETKYTLKNGKEIKVIIWDTAGNKRFISVALKAIKSVQGIILLFDITKRATFEIINLWLEEIKKNLDDPCMVLLGNNIHVEEEKWEVTREEANKFAKSKNLEYFEVSAKTKQGIDEGFSYIIHKTYDKIEKKTETKKEKKVYKAFLKYLYF